MTVGLHPDNPELAAHLRKWAKKLTCNAEIVIVRRFREYPDRAVGKLQRAEGSRKAHAI
jgi:hypothetical protein